MIRNSLLLLAILLPFAVGGVVFADLGDQEEGKIESSLAGAVKAAHVIVVGQVLGTIDREPAAQDRKAEEVHWVQARRTLKSYDVAGRRLKVRPNGVRWIDGAQYVLFLREAGEGFYEAIPQPVISGTDGRAINEVLKLGGGARPRLTLRMRTLDGCCSQECTDGSHGTPARSEFALMADGRFEWHKLAAPGAGITESRHEVRVGKLEKSVIGALLARVQQSVPGDLPDGGGRVTFEVAPDGGPVTYRTFSLLDGETGKILLMTLETLVRQHGVPPAPGGKATETSDRK